MCPSLDSLLLYLHLALLLRSSARSLADTQPTNPSLDTNNAILVGEISPAAESTFSQAS